MTARLATQARIMPFTCGHCGTGFTTKADKRRHKQFCAAPVLTTPAGEQCDDEDLYGFRRPSPRWLIEDANRQWDAIPTDPAAIYAWMHGEPINPSASTLSEEGNP